MDWPKYQAWSFLIVYHVQCLSKKTILIYLTMSIKEQNVIRNYGQGGVWWTDFQTHHDDSSQVIL